MPMACMVCQGRPRADCLPNHPPFAAALASTYSYAWECENGEGVHEKNFGSNPGKEAAATCEATRLEPICRRRNRKIRKKRSFRENRNIWCAGLTVVHRVRQQVLTLQPSRVGSNPYSTMAETVPTRSTATRPTKDIADGDTIDVVVPSNAVNADASQSDAVSKDTSTVQKATSESTSQPINTARKKNSHPTVSFDLNHTAFSLAPDLRVAVQNLSNGINSVNKYIKENHAAAMSVKDQIVTSEAELAAAKDTLERETKEWREERELLLNRVSVAEQTAAQAKQQLVEAQKEAADAKEAIVSMKRDGERTEEILQARLAQVELRRKEDEEWVELAKKRKFAQ